MKKGLKKNQVIITSLAILIAAAGYLNFADVDLGFKDQEASSSILEDVDYDLTDETALLDENGADGTRGYGGCDCSGRSRTYRGIRFCCPGKAFQRADPFPE